MDDDDAGRNMRNFGYYETTMKSHLHHHHHHHHQIPLQLMPTIDCKTHVDGRDSSVMTSTNTVIHQRDCGVHASHNHIDYLRDWIARYSALPGNNYSYSAQTEGLSNHYNVEMMRRSEPSSDQSIVRVEGFSADNSDGLDKKRSNGKPEKAPNAKKPKKAATNGARENGGGGSSVKRAKAPKKPAEVIINGIDMDISSIPIPVCSCTGVAQQCYRWGSGGWQSACCTTNMSMYPLPMSTKRRGARIAGRKMSLGAFKKVLEKLVSESYDFSNPIDMRTYWAKHGTNKFVTIR
ncbi:hypothetical protein Droror1_Dr00007247 [Drosera rotundifolia]